MNSRSAIFLDRDGTLMRDAGYCADPAQVGVFPGIPEALATLQARGFLLILVTNQSGIGRGFFTVADHHAVQAEFERQILPARLDAVYFCPHAPDQPCECRKPKPGMLLQAAREHNIHLASSYMLGDKPGDIEAGQSAGCRAILVTESTILATLTSLPTSPL